ncbi:hypothetical protein I2492_12770 [Budviciaceae bacterium CWB-B4]|uniref:Uncharacterized protein n=1 Tax=Limnobaculum xujianqingii TaxID=2738837 RepID=A0A9D7AJK8_9GAMM|nr:hypothetical protein [Limnobaculum xujianqingii]MBK5073913.1 hypothetical protein [Limnobaculum xujianqingii]MBK5177193.1 hypothetical protein [Limnobaculum xujianqingii]
MTKYISIYAISLIAMITSGYVFGSHFELTTTFIGLVSTAIASLIAALWFAKEKARKPIKKESVIFALSTGLTHALCLFPILFIAEKTGLLYFDGISEMIKMSVQFLIVSIIINPIVFYIFAFVKSNQVN